MITDHCCCTVSIFKSNLFFSIHSIYSHPSCAYDAIYVYDGYNSNNRLLGRLCGKKGATFHSTGSYLTVYFKSNYMNYYRGFRANYRVVCKSQLSTIIMFMYYTQYTMILFLMTYGISYSNKQVSFNTVTLDFSDGIILSVLSAASGSCRYNCGYQVGSCSCSTSCEYRGNCCRDYKGRHWCKVTTAKLPLQRYRITNISVILFKLQGHVKTFNFCSSEF